MPSNVKMSSRQRSFWARRRSGCRILYNLGLLFLFILGLVCSPWLVPLMNQIPKRRRTFGPRMGWCTYSWEKQPQGRQGARIWIHALSVGEVTAAQPLVARLMAQQDQTLYLSVSTLGGYQTARRLYAGLPVRLLFFPYDWPWAVKAVAGKIRPNLVVLVETDIWPNFLWEMQGRCIPVCLANVRLSDKTWFWYRRLAPAARTLFSGFGRIAVQTERDRKRFVNLGIDPGRVCVTGNIKFDVPYRPRGDDAAAALAVKLGSSRELKVIVAGSTHEGEETVLIQAFARLKSSRPDVILVIAPRDPRRAVKILKLAASHGLGVHKLSNPALADHLMPGELIVVDCFGVLVGLYDLADLTYVGGSLVAQGGHNPLEPAACGKPVLFGPDMRDFRQIADWLVQGGAAVQVESSEALYEKISALLEDGEAANAMGARARRIYLRHRGAVQRTLACFDLLNEK